MGQSFQAVTKFSMDQKEEVRKDRILSREITKVGQMSNYCWDQTVVSNRCFGWWLLRNNTTNLCWTAPHPNPHSVPSDHTGLIWTRLLPPPRTVQPLWSRHTPPLLECKHLTSTKGEGSVKISTVAASHTCKCNDIVIKRSFLFCAALSVLPVLSNLLR